MKKKLSLSRYCVVGPNLGPDEEGQRDFAGDLRHRTLSSAIGALRPRQSEWSKAGSWWMFRTYFFDADLEAHMHASFGAFGCSRRTAASRVRFDQSNID